MLPGPSDGAVSLADVLRDSLDGVRSGRVDRAGVVVVDGLGAEQLAARAGHARTLAVAMATPGAVLDTGVPTTTAAALASLTTGTRPGVHGMVGYTVRDPATGQVVNQLHGADDGTLGPEWQRSETLFERAAAEGLGAFAFGSPKYAGSGFSGLVLRGARYMPATTIAQRISAFADALSDRSWRGIAYCYLAELDMAGHDRGWQSSEWVEALEAVDAAVGGLERSLDSSGASAEARLTADHGMVDIPLEGRIVVPAASELWRGVADVGGEHRLVHLYAAPGQAPAELAARWLEAFGDRAWVATKDEAVEAGWFGAVDAAVAPRIGDVLVAARERVALYTEAQALTNAIRMVGQHGSWTSAETRVPLLRFGR